MRRTGSTTNPARRIALVVLLTALTPALAVAGVRERGRNTAPRPVRLVAGGDEIPVLLLARGITTMLALPDEANEALCGDLFDPSTGAGGYVVQRSGNDLFVKPLRAAGPSNLFVKAGRATFSFELRVVDAASAMRIVNVEAVGTRSADKVRDESIESERAKLAADRSELDRTRAAMEAELATRQRALEDETRNRAQALARDWVAHAAVVRIVRRDAHGGMLTISLAQFALRMAGRTYLECAVRNTGTTPVVIAAVELTGPIGSRTELVAVVAPGTTIRRMLDFEAAASRDAELRLVDPGGESLVRVRPFR